MAAEFDIEKSDSLNCAVAYRDSETVTVQDVTELICYSCYSRSFWRSYLEFMTS